MENMQSYVTLHDKTKHNIALDINLRYLQAKIVAQVDNYRLSLFGVDR
jgi:hypothetical protein